MGRHLIAVHGGAGRRRPSRERLAWLERALRAGGRVLERGGGALNAVQCAVETMEACGRFNAGRGAVRQEDGARRLDAALMEGAKLKAGAVTGVRIGNNPVTLARLVLEKTPHVLMRGEFARRLAGKRKVVPLARRILFHIGRAGAGAEKGESDTVGAVALDAKGTVATGTSTGGAPPMLPGRIGDSPLPGCGLYADNASGAVSCTGKGESIIRVALAAGICERLGRGHAPGRAARAMLGRMIRRVGGIAGVIVVDRLGRVALEHNGFMSAGYMRSGDPPVIYCRRGRIRP